MYGVWTIHIIIEDVLITLNVLPILQLIHRKDSDDPSHMVDPEAHRCLTTLSNLNTDAKSVYELYPNPTPFCELEQQPIWKEIALSPTRLHHQIELRFAIQKVESSRTNSE